MRLNRLWTQKLKKYGGGRGRRPGQAYRLAGIGRPVLALAVWALFGMTLPGGAMADWTLGSTIAGSQLSGTTFYSADVQSFNYGTALGSPTGQINNSIRNTDPNRLTNLTGTTRRTYYTNNEFSALGTVNLAPNGVAYLATDNYTLGPGAIVQASRTGTAASGQYTAIERTDVWGNYTHTEWNGYIGTASTTNAYAIETSGWVTLKGNNTINGTATAGAFNIGGSGIYFNGNVTILPGGGKLTYTAAGSVFMSGASALTGSVDFAGKDGTFNLSDGSNVTGNIDTSVARTGTLVFENNSTVNGNVGGTAAIKEIQANGNGTVVINGAANANTVNLNAAGTVAFRDGLNTSLADGTLGTVNFNNFDGTVQVGNDGGLTGNVVTATNNNGTLTFVSGTQSMTGQIGSSSKEIKTLNIGGTGTGGGIDTNPAVASTTTINGNIFAHSTVLNSDGIATNSELKLASGYNLTGTTVTTTDNGMGVLNLLGGTQRIEAAVGTNNMRLDQVISGVAGSAATFTGPVFADTVTNGAGTGSTTFNGNVTATDNIFVNAGTTTIKGDTKVVEANETTKRGAITITSGTGNFENNVLALNTNIGTGTGNFNTVGGTTDLTNLNFTGAGVANLNQGMTFTNLNYAGNDGTVNVSAGKNLTGTAITTAVTSGTGYLNLLGGNQTVNSTVGAAGLALNKITAGVDGATSNFTNGAAVYANTLDVSGNGTVNLAGGLTGNLNYADADAAQNGTANIAIGKDLTGNVTTALNNTGILNLQGGIQNVTGAVGTAVAAVRTINAGVDGATSTFTNGGAPVYAQTLNVAGNGTVNLDGGLTGNLNYADADAAQNGTANVAVGKHLTGNVTTALNNTGILNLTGGTQNVTGTVGASGAAVNTVNAGVDGATSNFTNGAAVYAQTLNVAGNGTVNLAGGLVGNLNYADVTAGQNGTVNVAAGKHLVGNVTTAVNNTDILNLQGGTQNVTGTVGAAGAAVKTINAGVDGATSNFTNGGAAVYAQTLNVVGNGTVNLAGGLTGNLNFADADASQNGTANIAVGKNLVGNVTTDLNNTGILNLLGGTQNVTGTVGLPGASLNTINAGANGATTNFTMGANVYATTLNVTGNGTVNLFGGLLVGSLNYTLADPNQHGTAIFKVNQNWAGNVTTARDNTGYLTLEGGAQTINGPVGAAGAALNTINAGAAGGTSTFSSMVYGTKLKYSGNGAVVLNGQNGGSATGGLVGTVDFDNQTGTLQVGDSVNLTTGTSGAQMANAGNSVMTFAGSSTVTGVLGGNTAGRSTLKSINAGVTGKTVTFKDDVYVSPTTFHVIGNGTVNFQGDLQGPLVFDAGADGVVNMSDTKSIIVTTATPAAFNTGDNVGTINFLGATTLSGDLGTSTALLKAVNFHSDPTVAAVNQNIDKNVYALATTIGNATQATVANVTADVFLGNAVTLAAGTNTLNTAGAVAPSALSPVDFSHTKNANGTLTNTAVVTDSTTGTGPITTNGATINFAVGTAPYVAGGTNGVIDAAGSSSITGGAGSTLVMNGTEKVNIALLGSTRNGESSTLIDVAAGAASPTQAATLQDNSFVIDTVLSRSATGDLVVTTQRDGNSYVTKSGTAGHFSNSAAMRLGDLGAAGTGYNSDMQLVLNKLDIDQWGFGNNQANLATQVKRLAPIANQSLTQSALAASTLSLKATADRLSALRDRTQAAGTSAGDGGANNGLWIKAVGSRGKQKQVDDFDGYTISDYGLVGGGDRRIGQKLVIGAALGFITADVKQSDFRDGESTRIANNQLMGYATYDITKALYVDAVLSGAFNNYDGKRITAVDRTASYDFKGSQLGAQVGMGYGINLDSKTKLTPMVSLDYRHLTHKSYAETGAGALNLNVDSQSIDRIQSGLGGRLTKEWSGAGVTYRPEVTVNWFYNAGTLNKDIVSSFEGGGTPFSTPTASIDRNTGNLGLAFTALYGNAMSVKLGYNLDVSKNYVGHTGSAYFCWDF